MIPKPRLSTSREIQNLLSHQVTQQPFAKTAISSQRRELLLPYLIRIDVSRPHVANLLPDIQEDSVWKNNRPRIAEQHVPLDPLS